MKQTINVAFRDRSMLRLRQLVYLFSFVLIMVPGLAKAIGITGPATVCQGDNATYSVLASSGNIYVWSPGVKGKLLSSGIVGSNSEANISWKKSGTSTVSVTLFDKITGAEIEHVDLTVTVLPRPNPVISWDVEVGCQIEIEDVEQPDDPADTKIDLTKCIKVCENSTVTYSVPVVAGSTYTWAVSGGTATPSGASCTVVWGAAGAGTIEVTETSAGGCIGKKFMCIEIVKKPTANFIIMTDPGAGPVNACIFDELVFKDLSTANGGTALIGWFWDFGDGATSGDANPTHAYTAAGTYTVRLKVKNECNCTSEYTIEVVVSDLAGVKIICPGLVCENSTAKYSVVDACTSYNWGVIGGTIITTGTLGKEIEILWNAVDDKGIGYVTFDAAACSVDCPSKTVIKVPVMKTSGIIAGKTVICTNKQYRYTLPRYPATVYNWSIAAGSTGAKIIHTDQTNEVVVEGPNAGYATLSCTYVNTLLLGCSGTASLNIELQNPPTITGSKLHCEGDTRSYTMSTSASADWTLEGPDGTITYSGVTFTYTFTTPGSYRLRAEGLFCWPEPVDIIVDALPPLPLSIEGPAELCSGSPGNFTAKSGEAKSVFVWRIKTGTGNLNVNSGSHTTFTPSGAGPWELAVKSRNKKAPMCESAEITYNINEPDVVSYDIIGDDLPCEQSYFSYHEEYTTGSEYEWTITPDGAGSVTAGQGGPHPTILWNAVSGSSRSCVLDVKFKQCGIPYTKSMPITIQPFPDPVINFDAKYCMGETVNPLIVSGTDLKGGSLAIDDWGDGTSGGSTHIYAEPKKYTILGRIVSPEDCDYEKPFTAHIEVLTPPVVSVTGAGPYCYPYGSAITLTAFASGTSVTYAWAGGPTGSMKIIPASPPLSLGTHTYTVTATDGDGCTTTENVDVLILDCSTGTPVALCVPKGATTLGGTDLIADCNGTVSTSFTKGGFFLGHSITKRDVSHTGDGAVFSTTGSSGTIDFTVDKTIVGVHKFSYQSTYIDAADDVSECPKMTTISVTVPHYVQFDWAIKCGTGGKYDVDFTSRTTFYTPLTGSSGHLYKWTVAKLGGGTTIYGPGTTLASTGDLPLDAGATYDITLEVETGSGTYTCSQTRRISLPNYPVASFTVDFTPICEGIPVTFNSTSTPSSGLTDFWDFGDGEGNGKNQRTYTFKTSSGSPNAWPSQLTVTDKYGCTDVSTSITVEVYQNKLGGTVTASPTLVCPDDPVSLSYSNLGIFDNPSTLVWMHGNTPIGFGTYPSGLTVTAPQSGSYYAILSGAYGCSKAATGTLVTVVNVPDPVIVGKPDVCVDEEFTLNAYAGDDIVSYSWEEYAPGGSWTSVSSASGPDYDLTLTRVTPGTHKYRVTISVAKTTSPMTFCTQTSEVYEVVVHGLPATPTIGYTMMDCATYELELTATSSDPGVFTWSNGLSGSPITVFEGGPYKVTLTDAFGCSSSAQDFILKDPKQYLWVFPVGCYELCPSPYFTLHGPAIPFSSWAWYKNYAVDAFGTNTKVNPYNLMTSGVYNLYLNNGLCAATSGDLNFNAKGCADSVCNQGIIISVVNITYDLACRATIQLSSIGSSSFPYSITPSMGGYVTVTGPPVLGGPPPIYVAWTAPAPGGYPSGTTVEFIVTVTLPGGALCTRKIQVYLDCPYGPVLHKTTDSSLVEKSSAARLNLAPNPAKDKTMISYAYEPDAQPGDRKLIVVDMVGRVLATYPIFNDEGSLELHFGEWASGVYRIVLMSAGKTVQTTPLSITR